MVIVREPTVEIESNQPTEDQQVAASDAFASQFSAAADIDAPVVPIEAESVPAPQPTIAPSPPVVEQSQPVVEPQIAPPTPAEPVQQTTQAVTPKRAPIGSSSPSTPATGWPAAPSSPPEQSALDSVSDLVSGGPHAPRAPAQPIHHNIQSGKNCSRCGIGVEQSWQYCPVCNGNL